MRFLRMRPLRIDLGDVLVQIIAVFLGVICAFGVNSWQTRNSEQALLRATLRGIVVEIQSNHDSLQTVKARHATSLRALMGLLVKARTTKYISITDLLLTLKNRGEFGINAPLDIAWQIAQSNQGLSLLSYDDRYTLAALYRTQGVFYDAERRYGDTLLSIRQSPTDNYLIETIDLANQANVVVVAETQLDALYTDALKKIR
ncbi:MAG TPA: hypothetical protein VK760_12185 [Candidatus Acidoferrales bacterium]|jgi:hypothetical protein|nr:hypothetical protein [Candidatus Acidoferrales bacterium]